MQELLKTNWLKSGIEPGDTVLVHSSIKRTLSEALKAGYELSPENILDSFLEALGPNGTLVLPLFNFDFTTGTDFDIRHTPSHMGALTEAARLREGAVRTGHPIYSFAAIGKNAHAFEGIDNESAYGPNSPFAVLRELNGKIAVLDLPDQHSMTMYHHVEELKQVDYRYYKSFSGNYTDRAGNTSEKTYRLYVRDLERGVLTDVNPAGELMWQAGLYKGDKPKEGTGLRVIGAQDMFNFTSALIDEGKALGTLYSIDK